MTERWFWIDLVALLVLGLVGGLVAQRIGLPLPFMLGALALGGAYTIGWTAAGRAVRFPKLLRHYFVAVIGTMIGSRFTVDVLGLAASMWPSFLAVLVFVGVTYAFGYAVFRGFGRYDRATATYAAMPGGLIEAVTMGEKDGADVRVLTVQHFARISLVVVIVPFAFLWLGGEAVGSAAGEQLDSIPAKWIDYVLIAVIAAVGMVLGRRLRLPAAQFMGPLVLCALCQSAGVTDLHPPAILMNGAQLVVGAGLGAQFAGLTLVTLARAFGLGLICVSGMLCIAAAVALGLTQIVAQPFEPLFISFAPGGMTEMGLIALSLDASPILVTAHHLLRIIVTVLGMGLWVRLRADDAA